MWRYGATPSAPKKYAKSAHEETSPALSRVTDALQDVRAEMHELNSKLQGAKNQIEEHIAERESSEAKIAELEEQRSLLDVRVANLTLERDELLRHCNDLQSQVNSSKEMLDSATEHRRALEEELEVMRKERDNARDRCNVLERGAAPFGYTTESDFARAEIRAYEDQGGDHTEATTDALRPFQKIESVAEKGKDQSDNDTNLTDLMMGSRKTLRVWTTLLATKTAELRQLQSSWPLDKSLSGENVAELVSRINVTIAGIAAVLAKKVKYLSGPRPRPSLNKQELEETVDIVGLDLFKHLKDRDHSDDSHVVQLALQTGLVAMICMIFPVWPVPYFNVMHEPSRMVLGKILLREHQISTWRWRALGITNVKLRYSGGYSEAASSLKNCLIVVITRILLCAGLQAKYTDASNQVIQLVGNDLERLWNLNVDFAEKTREQVSFVDYSTILIKPGVAYDTSLMCLRGNSLERAKRRQSEVDSTQKTERVLCAVEMGLQRIDQSTVSKSSTYEGVVIAKPVVLLESEIDDVFVRKGE